MNVLIVDDDINFINTLKQDFIYYFRIFCHDLNFEIKTNDFHKIEMNEIDIAFIDIDLKSCNGIVLAENLRKQFPTLIIIFISSREELVFKTLVTGVFQFIRKAQYESDKFIVFNQLNEYLETNYLKKIIKTKGNDTVIQVIKIEYIISIGHDIVIQTKDKSYTTKSTMKEMLEYLNYPFIVQIQKGLAINLKYIKKFKKDKVLTLDGKEHNVGRKYQENLLIKYKEFLLS